MDRWTDIRRSILVEGVGKRQVMREEGKEPATPSGHREGI